MQHLGNKCSWKIFPYDKISQTELNTDVKLLIQSMSTVMKMVAYFISVKRTQLQKIGQERLCN